VGRHLILRLVRYRGWKEGGTSQVGQHRKPEKRINNAEDRAGDDWAPGRGLAVAGVGEPEEGSWNEPDTNQRGKEASLWTVDSGVVLDAVALEQVGLDENNEEHDDHCSYPVEVCQFGLEVTDLVSLLFGEEGGTYERCLLVTKTLKSPSRYKNISPKARPFIMPRQMMDHLKSPSVAAQKSGSRELHTL